MDKLGLRADIILASHGIIWISLRVFNNSTISYSQSLLPNFKQPIPVLRAIFKTMKMTFACNATIDGENLGNGKAGREGERERLHGFKGARLYGHVCME